MRAPAHAKPHISQQQTRLYRCAEHASNYPSGKVHHSASVLSKEDSAAVKDIVYSPGEDVFLVVRTDGQLFLVGVKENAIKMEFTAPQGGVSRAVWIDAISGDFLVCSSKVGVLRLYNAANPICKEIIKVSRHGITDLKRMSDQLYLIKLTNGQITQFNIRTKRTLYTTEVGHTHQIQKAKIHPSN